VAATVTVTPDVVAPGEVVVVSWTGGQNARDWYCCYKIGEEHEYGWAYTSSCSELAGATAKPTGSCSFTMPAELGIYEFHLYADNGYERIATSNPVTVAEPVPEPEPPDEERMLAWIIPIRDPAEIKRLMRSKKPKS
jgi:hypothetical protein